MPPRTRAVITGVLSSHHYQAVSSGLWIRTRSRIRIASLRLERKKETERAMASEYRCVGCGLRVKSLFIQYSPGNIRLMKCGNCKEVADEYIECERMIIFIDLVLHRPKVYRHVLYNEINQETVNIQAIFVAASVVEVGLCLSSSRLFLKLLIKDRSLLLRRTHEHSSLVLITMKVVGSSSFFLISFCRLIRIIVLVDVLSTNLAFLFSFAIAAKVLLHEVSRKREILLGILISSYFKIFLLAMLVWEFPVSVIFIIDILVLTSNSMALKVMTESSTSRCIVVCLIAHTVRFLAGQIFEPTTFFTQFGSIVHLSSLFRIL
ncbi:hypothetical protein DY000_02044208 [Brassica cretica]|uniref:Protein ARV n=1 Tax=Brassica cretica TaxID=69181 RepID=A0ABQ7ENM4_BRACR|nr:hypothetical protein DY000_02044208 [Brassica cretica]